MNLLLTKENVKEKNLEYYIGVISNRLEKDEKYFKVIKSFQILLSNGEQIEIEEGFQFDGSSTPKYLTWLLPRYGSFFIASLIHDWLYVFDYKRTEMGVKRAQKIADGEMLFWSNIVNNRTVLKRLDNKVRYLAVRMFGKKIYKR